MLSDTILQFLCKKGTISYILFSPEFKIIEFSENISSISDTPQNINIGSDIRDSFWEFIGIEEKILELLKSNENTLKIPMIYKNSKYYDIEIEPLKIDKYDELFIAYIDQKSTFSVEYFKTIQELNKKTLILQTQELKTDKQKNYYDLINQNIISFHVNTDGIIIEANSICIYFLGKNENEVIGQHFSVFFHTRESNINNNQTKIFNAISAQGDNIFFHAEIIPIQNDGIINENIIICQDITHLKKIEKKLEYAANHDSLTGLPNRSLLLQKIDKAIEKSEDNSTNFSLCFIDLNNFKQVNDTYGHHAGDMLLKHVSSTLSSFVREDDSIARIGGDEFVILFIQLENQDYLNTIIQRIQKSPDKYTLVYNETDEIQFSFSIGVSHYPKNGTDAKSLLDYANKEMYKSKK